MLEDETKRDEAALEIANKIAECVVSPSEMELLKATFRLDNRFTALEALNTLELIFRDGMAVYVGAKAELNAELAEKLCRKLTKAHFLGLMEITKTAKENIEKNIPLKLVSTWLCAQYRRTVWQKWLKTDEAVIVETARGIECGKVALANKEVPDEEILHPLKPLIRKATDNDLAHIAENKKREKEAFKTCEKKIAEHKLKMNLVDVEYTFDNNKILFYFTADGRVDQAQPSRAQGLCF